MIDDESHHQGDCLPAAGRFRGEDGFTQQGAIGGIQLAGVGARIQVTLIEFQPGDEGMANLQAYRERIAQRPGAKP